MKKCPFIIGEYIIYRPSFEGRGRVVMTDLQALKPGEKYKVVRIIEESYVVIEGFESSPGGGLFWTEFERILRFKDRWRLLFSKMVSKLSH